MCNVFPASLFDSPTHLFPTNFERPFMRHCPASMREGGKEKERDGEIIEDCVIQIEPHHREGVMWCIKGVSFGDNIQDE